MAEIFISYKSERRAAAEHFAEVLKRHGYSVWFDYELVKGKDFAAQIERQIRGARTLVALWCSLSVSSRWVREEVHLAHDLGILVPVKIEPCEIPFGFRLADTVDLAGWDGSPRSPALDPLIDALEGRIGRDAVPERKALIEYEATWRRFGAHPLKDFARNKALAPAEIERFGLNPAPPPPSAQAPKTGPETAVRHGDASPLALAAEAWGPIKDTADIAKLRRFVQHFPGTYYTELAEERIAELEEAARAKAAAEAAALAKAQAEAEARAREDARIAELKGKIGSIGDRDTLLSLLRDAPEAAGERLQALGFLKVPSRKEGKPHTYWLKPGESFRDLDAGPEMVIVPAGEFWMGSKDGEGDADERPRHKVTIAKAFAVGRYAVTFDEWDAAKAAGGVLHNPSDEGWGRGRRPVINVNWEEAQAYITWLSSKTGQPYRLLSEAEWEYCCRAGTSTHFWWGGEISTDLANYDGNYTFGKGAKGEYRQKTLPVDSFQPNPWGLYQVHGNVWEWCQDCWNDNYHNAPADGSAWTTADCCRRVLRGGSWFNLPQLLRSAIRIRYPADYRFGVIGFRLARTLI